MDVILEARNSALNTPVSKLRAFTALPHLHWAYKPFLVFQGFCLQWEMLGHILTLSYLPSCDVFFHHPSKHSAISEPWLLCNRLPGNNYTGPLFVLETGRVSAPPGVERHKHHQWETTREDFQNPWMSLPPATLSSEMMEPQIWTTPDSASKWSLITAAVPVMAK